MLRHDSMMRWALTHLLMIFQNMLLHFPPVVHSAHLLNATFLAGSRKISFSAQRVMFCFFLICFFLTVLICIQTRHWSSSGAWTWCAEWYCSSEILLLSKRKPYFCPLDFILFLPPTFGNRSNINQKENWQCFYQSSMGLVAGEHKEKQREEEEEGYKACCGQVVKLAYSDYWFCNMTPLLPPARRW